MLNAAWKAGQVVSAPGRASRALAVGEMEVEVVVLVLVVVVVVAMVVWVVCWGVRWKGDGRIELQPACVVEAEATAGGDNEGGRARARTAARTSCLAPCGCVFMWGCGVLIG